ncbi:hypothetical protein CDQ68_01225 [Campylobacter hyointestinalis subsp. hyointestinalis]|uniref:PP0621 family protein n=1 Tax=Campylobacter hyointestinalis TaxID=198 RepID=UPI000CE444C9|nr:PP0621 family protein [Campylobacter hyointestinalis]PPB53337.1 hypothetical protein CDQ68_01225 [Campylobacter hyointestinalis subsp. hyointestinalis]PPB70768.1 hypothetical protein CDQ77_01230 [Campylobacter hyointestinalis subsp. hyointestinalis]
MLGKIIIFGVIIAIIYFFILPKFRKKTPKNSIENFVECDECKTFISMKDTILKDGKYVCKECLK